MLRQLLASPGLLTSSTLGVSAATSSTGSLLGALHRLSISVLTPSAQFATKAAGGSRKETTAAKKKTTKAAPEDKRPATVFALFLKDNFASIRNELPTSSDGKPAPPAQVTKEASLRYNKLKDTNSEELKPYKQQYEASSAAYKHKKEAKEASKAPPIISGYTLYLREHIREFQQPGKTPQQVLGEVGHKWSKGLSTEEKQAYIDRAKKENASKGIAKS